MTAPTQSAGTKGYPSSLPANVLRAPGVAAGDLLVVLLYVQANATPPSVSQPAGTGGGNAFALSSVGTISAGPIQLSVFYWWATAFDAGTTDPYPVSGGGNTEVDFQMFRVRWATGGPTSGDPFSAGNGGAITVATRATAGTTTAPISLTTASPSLVVWAAGANAAISTTPTGYTIIGGGGTGDNSSFAALTQTTAGSTGTLTATQGSANSVVTLMSFGTPVVPTATPGPHIFTQAAAVRAASW